MRYFKKELVERVILTEQGWPIPFEDVGDGWGALATNDPYTITQLEILLRSKNPKGVIEVETAEEFEEFKKKAAARNSFKASTRRNETPRLVEANPRPVSPATSAAPAIHDPSIEGSKKTVGEVLKVPAEIKVPAKRGRKPNATKVVAGEAAEV